MDNSLTTDDILRLQALGASAVQLGEVPTHSPFVTSTSMVTE